jgi:uncharacterized protein (TIGR02996 family)
MDLRASLLQAIFDEPDNDTPRLVYADLLDESDDPADRARAGEILARADLTKLRTLQLDYANLSPTGLAAILGRYSSQLRFLSLSGNPLGDTGAAMIAAADWTHMAAAVTASREVGLVLDNCQITADARKQLQALSSIPILGSG